MELIDDFDLALDEFDRRVRRIGADQWHAGTPCAEWSVRDLVNHLTGEQLWAPWLLRGATLTEVGDRFDGDVLGAEPVRTWQRAAESSRAAFHQPDALDQPVHTSGGPTPADEYARQMTLDLTVHAWDLARGIGAEERLDPDLVTAVHRYVEPRISDWQGAGLFDPPVDVPESADQQVRLLALLGRRSTEPSG